VSVFKCMTCGAVYAHPATHMCPPRPEARLDALEARIRAIELTIGTLRPAPLLAPEAILPERPFIVGASYYCGVDGKLTAIKPFPESLEVGKAIDTEAIVMYWPEWRL
jgi:hypothetical protein